MIYTKMAKYYEDIFPISNRTAAFLNQYMTSGVVVDLACGTGGYARWLAKSNPDCKVYGLDLDEGMIEQGNILAEQEDVSIELLVEDMITGLDHLPMASMIYCIGNSIVHLQDDEKVLSFLEKVREKLLPQSTFILGLLNYDRILEKHITQLPDIILEKDNIAFMRTYENQIKEDTIMFKTTLLVNSEVESGSVKLLLLTHDRLKRLIEKAGFSAFQAYDGFQLEPYNPQETYTTVWIMKA